MACLPDCVRLLRRATTVCHQVSTTYLRLPAARSSMTTIQLGEYK
jgi:hypothetical protein